MFNSTTLEVAIGMALVYLLLSLFCTAINEAISGFLGLRAKNLEEGIRNLFTEGELKITTAASANPAGNGSNSEAGYAAGYAGGPPTASASAPTTTVTKVVGLVDAVYQHGLIQSLYRSGTGIENAIARKVKNLPSYIPSRTFASALYDLLFPPEAASAAAPGAPAPAAAEAQAARLRSMLTSLENIQGNPAKQAIATLVKQADGDADKTRKAFERWYNDGMDRAAGWYKRRTQWALLAIGLAIAVVLNVDSIRVAEVLWTNPALRTYAVSLADKYAKENPVLPKSNSSQPGNTNPAATTADAAGSNAGTSQAGGTTHTAPANPSSPQTDPMDYIRTLQSLNLPMGWNLADVTWIRKGTDNSIAGLVHRIRRRGFCLALIGWFLTAVAMTLGAPFWFDTLNQFMVIRSTIKPEEKSQPEASKDPQKS
jgi:hypothetical protein